VRQAVKEQFGGFGEAVAAGVLLRHDHGFKFMSVDFQAELRFLGMESSPAILLCANQKAITASNAFPGLSKNSFFESDTLEPPRI
jgi:hypothetical protein